MNPNNPVVIDKDTDYNDFRNLIIYKTIQALDSKYFKNKLPDYLNDELSWIHMVGALKGYQVKAGAETKISNVPLLKKFFAEATVNGNRYYSENSINEKTAWIEVFLDLASDILSDDNKNWRLKQGSS